MLPVGTADHGHQFRDLFTLVGLVAAGESRVRRNATRDPSALPPRHAATRPAPPISGDDVDAVAVLVDHLGEAADLALDPAEAFLAGYLDVFSHGVYIPLQGIGYKRRSGR
jgi:hypothetical protein